MKYNTFILLILIEIAICEYTAIVVQIDQLSKLKQADAVKKNNLLSNISKEQAAYKKAYAEAIQRILTAKNSYSSYFLQKNRCQSLNPQNDVIGNISALPNKLCLVAPLGTNAKDVYTIQQQLSAFQYEAGINQKLISEQISFNADYVAQQDLYSKLEKIAFYQLQAANKLYQECLKKYSTSTNNQPPQCNTINNNFNKTVQVFNNYHGRALSFGRLFKLPLFDLEIKQRAQANVTSAINALNQSLVPKLTQLQSQYKICLSNLSNIKTTANKDLVDALQSNKAIDVQMSKLSQIYKTIASHMSQIKVDTTTLKNSANKLKNQFP